MEWAAQGTPLEMVTPFRYFGRILMALDSDWTAVQANLRKAKQSWTRIVWVLTREGASLRTSGSL